MAMSRGAALRRRYPFKPPSTAIDHLVVGGGVVGLSVAAGLVNTAGRGSSTFLVDSHVAGRQRAGSSRSAIVQSGIYHPIGSLKSRLCIRGRDLLYARCSALNIPCKRTEKLIVAASNSQVPWLDHLSTRSAHPSLIDPTKPSSLYSSNSSVPAYFLSPGEALDLEPDLSRDIAGALLVTDAGIVDVQALSTSLEKEITDEGYLAGQGSVEVGSGSGQAVTASPERDVGGRGDGVVLRGTRAVRMDRDEKDRGWVVQLETGWKGLDEGDTGEIESVLARVVVNAAGQGAARLMHGVIPDSERVELWPVKNTYMSYSGPGVSRVSRLIHTCPHGDGEAGHSGSHLTRTLDGEIRFGPLAEPLDAAELAATALWQGDVKLAPTPAPSDLALTLQEHLPGIDPSLITGSYAHVTAELSPEGSGASDLVIRHSADRTGLIELYGFTESGVTATLAVGEYVAAMVGGQVHGNSRSLNKLADGWDT